MMALPSLFFNYVQVDVNLLVLGQSKGSFNPQNAVFLVFIKTIVCIDILFVCDV